ncbi:MAG: hypothetical protein R3C20_20865 [Planctomycetaceae bacterium]
MTLGTFRQQIGFMFFIASAILSVIGDYVWAYHFASYDRKFPTPWSVFELSLQISMLVVPITVVLFLLPTLLNPEFTLASPSLADYSCAGVLGGIVQLAILLSPHIVDRASLFLTTLVLAPIVAGGTFARLRRRDSVTAKPLEAQLSQPSEKPNNKKSG